MRNERRTRDRVRVGETYATDLAESVVLPLRLARRDPATSRDGGDFT